MACARWLWLLGVWSLEASAISAQTGGGIAVRVTQDNTIAVEGALVRAGVIRGATNADGIVRLRLPVGSAVLIITKIGFRPESLTLQIHSGLDSSVAVRLASQLTVVTPVFVTSTRTERRLEEEPLRIEVLGGDDISEKSAMRPADSRTLLSEMSGVRVQTRSPLGATNARIQGLPGRYTAILSDGLPLFGGQASGFTLVDVVPLDLRQVEVIKGAASALYGPQALGGAVNLISRRLPDTSQTLLNLSAPSSADVMAFAAHSIGASWGGTVLAGLHQQRARDGDGDRWMDVAGFRRVEARPRLFFDDRAGHSLMITGGGFVEDRSAGSPGVLSPGQPGPRAPFYDSLITRHGDVGVIGQWRTRGALSFAVRASASTETRTHRVGDSTDRGDRRTAFAEVSASETRGSNFAVAGLAMLTDTYSNAGAARLNSAQRTPAAFVQDTYTPIHSLSGTANARCDRSNVYGTICTSRLSIVGHLGPEVSARLSGGSGWFGPTALTDETETFALNMVRLPQPLAAEHGQSASFDVTATHGPLQLNGTLFAHRIANPVGVRRVGGDTTGLVDVINAAGPLTTHGAELFAVFNQEPLIVTAHYAVTRTRETSTETGRHRELPLVPRQAAGVDIALEDDESGAYGAVEIFYTGLQSLEDNTYAAISTPYTTVGVLLSDRWRAVTLFVNGENLTNVRLTQFQPLLRARPGEGGRWTVDPWAPLEGRRVNAGLRWHW